MRVHYFDSGSRWRLGAVALLATVASVTAAVGAGNGWATGPVVNNFTTTSPFRVDPPAAIGASGTLIVAQSSRDMATLNVKIAQLEEQVRLLNGQVEGLQFQLTQMQTYMERLQEDYDARLAVLEGGTAPGKTEAATQSGGAMPAEGLPQIIPPVTSPVMLEGEFVNEDDILIDPESEGFVLGDPAKPLGSLSANDIDLSNQPLDLSSDSGSLVNDADAEAQYKAGYDAVVRGDYSFAEDQFRQFIALFPNHHLAPEATHWLGEALILRGANEEAADILLHGFQTYPNSPRAPDLLLKLGMALSGAGEGDTACRTFGETVRRFPDQPGSFKQRLNAEMDKAGC